MMTLKPCELFKFDKLSLLLIPFLVFASGCSTLKSATGGGESADRLTATGPTVLNARINPETIELDRNMDPMQQVEILAEVKDFSNEVTDVRLSFEQVPMEVEMNNVGGTTWRADLSREQIHKLAIGNQTTHYDARVIAKDARGKVAVSEEPLKVAIKAPDLSAQPG